MLLFGMMSVANAQDVIKIRNGENINAKVVEMSESQVKYKKSTNLNGPVYVLEANKVASVTFENGDKETFVISDSDNKDLKSIKKDVRFMKNFTIVAGSLAALGIIAEVILK